MEGEAKRDVERKIVKAFGSVDLAIAYIEQNQPEKTA